MNIDEIVEKNQASQSRAELKKLLETLPDRYREAVVEIGVHQGYSLLNWRRAFNPHVLIGVDNSQIGLREFILEQAQADFIWADSNSIETVKLVEEKLHGHKIDFLFIDGDHSYDAVKRDFELYTPLMNPGGEIVFHDAVLQGHPLVEVYKFWQEIKDKYKNITINEDDTGYGVILNYE